MLVDEGTFDKIKDYEHSEGLSVKQKVTLKLTDAYLMGTGVDDSLRDEVFDQFTPAQAVALTLKAVNYTSQKLLVVLGADMAVTGGERTDAGFHLMRYEQYIDNLMGERILLPTAKRPGF